MAERPMPDTPPPRRCARCLLLETHDTLVFDEAGVCNVCRNIEVKQQKVDWAAREREFVAILDEYRGKYAYDCIVPFSGGKDSTFTLWMLVERYRLKPLVVCFDHGFMRPTVLANTERTIRRLGVDFLKFRPNAKVVQKLMVESLRRKGDFCWHCHTGIFSFPMQMALRFAVPLLVWGQPNTEYNAYFRMDEPELVDEKRFNRYVNLGITAEDRCFSVAPLFHASKTRELPAVDDEGILAGPPDALVAGGMVGRRRARLVAVAGGRGLGACCGVGRNQLERLLPSRACEGHAIPVDRRDARSADHVAHPVEILMMGRRVLDDGPRLSPVERDAPQAKAAGTTGSATRRLA